MKKLGQHFLKNKKIIEKIVDAIEVSPGDNIIEIGPGHGELTIPLLHACNERNARLSVIEKDQRLAANLEKELGKSATLISGDALGVLEGILSEQDFNKTKLVGNLPYYITGKIFRTISELPKKPKRCVFMIQKEVAERMCATPPHMNRLAASIQFWARPRIIMNVSRWDFLPPPQIESSVIILETETSLPMEDVERYYAAIRAIFSQPRKTLGNNIASNLKEGGVSKEDVIKRLGRLGNGISPSSRPQDLSINQIVLIAGVLF